MTVLCGAAIFLGAFLLFLIEPVFAKLILPWFGGTAAVWTTCLVFFQVALLAGYLYAHAMVRGMRPRMQAAVHSALLIATTALLPAIPGTRWEPGPGTSPVIRLIEILTIVLGAPFFLLATTGPLLQSWYARTRHQPYRFFALSNAAALIALIAYPILIEPNLATRAQDRLWSAGFVVFAAVCVAIAWFSSRPGSEPLASARADAKSLVTWFTLAAGGSMLLLSTTNQLTQNVAAVPLLWILPLIVYLATFILCFDGSRWYRRGPYLRMVVVGFAAVAYMIYDIQLSDAIVVSVPVFLFGLFAGCMLCHGELSARKPVKEQLTSFYVMIAAGGAAGSVFVGLIAPAMFSGVYELAVTLMLVSAMALALNWGYGWNHRLVWATLTATLAIVVGAQVRAYHRNAVVVARDFYGVLRVVDAGAVRRMYHGTIEHGSQFMDSPRRRLPTTYYGPPSGAGLALRNCCDGPRHVGIVGLGAGTLAAYGSAGDRFRFYEIDPKVVDLARTQFSFLSDTAASVQIAVGDARLSLEHEAPQQFDVLIIDAFSGDAIPVHLLTREAFEIYRRHLKPSGILAAHVSNQFLDLAPVVADLATAAGMRAVRIDSAKDEVRDLAAATWVLGTCNQEFLGRAEIANIAKEIPARRNARRWTDDYNNLLQVLR